jgi:hypothetical protein
MRLSIQQLILLILVFLGGALIGASFLASPTIAPTTVLEIDQEQATASYLLDFGDGRVKTLHDVPVSASTTVFDGLEYMADSLEIDLQYQDYGEGMGIFVQAIDGMPESGDTMSWWQYWVNNEYAEVGPSNFHLEPGDVVMWKLTAGQLSI